MMIDVASTPQKAYTILKMQRPNKVAKACVEFSNFYAFYMIEKELFHEPLISSRFVDAVDKKSGKTFEYDMFSDMNAYRNARNINVRTLK